MEQFINRVEANLRATPPHEIQSRALGEMTMSFLRERDSVSYVRFASVYRNFREARDFEAFVGEISGQEELEDD